MFNLPSKHGAIANRRGRLLRFSGAGELDIGRNDQEPEYHRGRAQRDLHFRVPGFHEQVDSRIKEINCRLAV